MKSFSDFKKSSPSAILMLGPPGVGKTTTSCKLGKQPYIADLDNNTDGPFRYFLDKKLPCNALVDCPHIKEDGTLVPRAGRWAAMNDCITKACIARPDIDVISIAGLSGLVGYALDEVRRQQGRAIGDPLKGIKDGQLEIQDWGAFVGLMRQWFLSMRGIGKTLIVEGHLNVELDAVANFQRVFVHVPGQFRNEIAGLFTDVWFLSIEQKGTDYIRTIRTVPNGDREGAIGLKSGLQLPKKFEINYDVLNNQLGLV